MTEHTPSSSHEGNVKIFTIRAFLRGIYNGMHRVIYQPFVLSLNPSMTVLGLLEGLGGYQGLLGAMIRPFFGWLSDRVQRKPFIVLGSLLTTLSIGFFLASGLTNVFYFVIPAILLMGIALLDMPIVDSFIADSVKPRDRGAVYSHVTLAMIVPGTFAPFLGGMLADRFGFLAIFVTGLIVQGAVTLPLICYLRETPLPRRAISSSEFYSFVKRTLAPPRALRNVYVMHMLDAFVAGLGHVLIFGMFRAHFHFSGFQLGVISVFQSVVSSFTQIFIGRLAEKYGSKRLIFVSYLSFVLYLGGMALAQNFLMVLLTQFFMGIAIAMWHSPLQTLMANSTTPMERAEAMGRISFYRGIVGFLAPFLGGFLYEQYGYSAPLWASFMVGGMVTVFIHFSIHVQDDRLI